MHLPYKHSLLIGGYAELQILNPFWLTSLELLCDKTNVTKFFQVKILIHFVYLFTYVIKDSKLFYSILWFQFHMFCLIIFVLQLINSIYFLKHIWKISKILKQYYLWEYFTWFSIRLLIQQNSNLNFEYLQCNIYWGLLNKFFLSITTLKA